MARMILRMKKKPPVLELPAPEKLEALPVQEVQVLLAAPEAKPVPVVEDAKVPPKQAPKPKQAVPKPKKKGPAQQPKKLKKVYAENSKMMIAARELLAKLEQNHPALFPVDDTPPKPWKVYINIDIKSRYDTSLNVTKQALELWLDKHFLAYQNALIDGVDRYDLDGQPFKPIIEQHKEFAKKLVAKRLAEEALAKAEVVK